MIQTEFYTTREDGINLYRTRSSNNFIIEQEQTGARYTEAIDIENSPYTYIETDIQIEYPEENPEDTREALNILLGR